MARTWSAIVLIVGVTFVVAAQPARAADESAASSEATPAAAAEKLTKAQREFAAAYVSAVNSVDIDVLRKLVAPEVVACNAKETKPFLDKWLRKQLRMAVSVDYDASFEPYKGGLQTSPLLAYPAKPTQTMKIEFGAGPTKDVTLTRQVTREKNQLYLVGPCLSAAGVQRFRQEEKKRQERIDQAHAIYDKLEDPLRTQLRKLVQQNKMSDAVQLCSSKLRVNQQVARDVLLLLSDREPETD